MRNLNLSNYLLYRAHCYPIKLRLATLFLLISFCNLQASTHAQDTRVSIDLDNVSTEVVFDKIESLSDFRFLYNLEKVDIDRKVSVHVKEELISNVLKLLFDETDVDFSVKGNLIILKASTNTGDVDLADNKTKRPEVVVSGKVTENSGIPLPGATVIEKGTANGTVTDVDGNYSINTNTDNPVLVFSFIGYLTKEIAVNNQTTIDVSLAEGTSELDEVIVTALGIQKEARVLGYSVAKIDQERIMASGTPVNALQSLYGAAAGVTVGQTATGPAGGIKINIRNAVSFDQLSTTRPLMVVDGIPIHDENTSINYNARTGRDNGTGINDINPDDIESIEILKGAKASVLYGSEGANGVVLITTKSGSRGQGLGVTASFTTTVEEAAFFPDLQDQYGTGRSPSVSETDDQGFFLNDDGQRALDPNGAAFGPRFDPNVNLLWWDDSARPWAASGESVYEQMLRQGSQQTANVALSAGGENGSARFSYTNTQYSPIYPGAEYTKNAFSVSATHELNDFISLKYSGNYYITDNLNSAYAGSFDAQGARSSLGAFSRDIDVGLINQFLVTDDGFNYFQSPERRRNFISNGRSSVVGSLWDWTQNESIFNRQHNIQSLTVDLRFNDIFSASILGGIDHTTEREQYKGKLQDPDLIGPNSGSVFTDRTRTIRRNYGQGTLNFDTYSGDFGFSGFVGGVIRQNYSELRGAERIGGFVVPNFFSFSNLPSGVQPNFQFDNTEDVLYSLLGSFEVDWKDQVYLEAQARQDWSSILPPQNNSYFYPGVSATWIASSTFNLPEVVQFLKIRSSWADVGRPGPVYFSNVNLGVSASGGGFIFSPPGDLPPIDINTFIPNLQPERKREFELGLEAFFFQDQRIGVDFSMYHANTYDQIMKITAPPGLGVNNIRINAGDVATTGWELALKTKPVLSGDFQWNVDVTFAAASTKVLELDGDLNSLSLWSTNGLNAVAEVGGEYGLIFQQSGNQHYINPSDSDDPSNGKRIVQNNGERYAYSTRSNKLVGKILPDVTGGVFSRFKYKNLSLVVNMDYSFGATFIHEAESYMMAAGALDETLPYRDAASGGIAYYLDETGQKVAGTNPNGGATYNDGVLLDGVNPDGTPNEQVVAAEDYYYASYFSNGFFPEDRLFKSDYIALRNVALDYKLPYSLAQKLKMQELTLSVFANNVGYLYRAAPNTVPESTNGTGWRDSNYGTTALPLQRSVGASVRVRF